MKRTAALMVLHLVCVACSSSSSGGMAKQPDTRSGAITLYDVHHSMIAQLLPDGTVTDGASRVVTHYDASTRSMSLLGAKLDVADSVHVTGARELDVHVGALGPWHVRVLPSNEVEVDGQSFGFVNGIDISEAGMFRLGVLLCVVPLVGVTTSPHLDAGVSARKPEESETDKQTIDHRPHRSRDRHRSFSAIAMRWLR